MNIKFKTKDISSTNLGIIYMLISSLCLSLMGALLKALSSNLPSIEIVFFRNLIGIALIAFTFYKFPVKQIGKRPWLLIFRGIAGFIAMFAYIYNVANIPLADAVAYSRVSPLFTAIFAMIFLGERIGFKGWVAILVGFTGMYFVMQPSLNFNANHIFGLVNAIFAALAFTSIRELKNHYDTRVIVLSFMSMGTLFPLIFMGIAEFISVESLSFIAEKFVMPEGIEWVYLFFIGLFSSLSQVFMTKAYSVTKAGIVGAVGYSVIVFSVIIGYMMGDPLPNLLAFFGIALIIVGGGMNAIKKRG